MRRTTSLAVVVTFTAMIVGSDFALTGVYNVKLLDTLVFVSAFVFGFRVGAFVGILSETLWSFVSPNGAAGAIAPFLIAGELLFAFAGWAAAKAWGKNFKVASPYPLFIGALLAICAFVWDFETNAATALLYYWSGLTLQNLLWTAFNPYTLAFAMAHEVSDFAFGTVLAPVYILLIHKSFRGGP